MEHAFDEEDEVIYDKTSLLQQGQRKRTTRLPDSRSQRSHICRLISLLILFFCLGMALAIPGPTLRCFEYLTQTDEHLVSCLFVGRAGGILIASLLTHLLLDIVPADCLSVMGLLLLAAAHFFIPWSQRVWWLVGAFTLQGAAIGLALSGALALTRLLYGARHLSYRHIFLLSLAVGAALTPFLVMPFQVNTESLSGTRHFESGGHNLSSGLAEPRLTRHRRDKEISTTTKRDGVQSPPDVSTTGENDRENERTAGWLTDRTTEDGEGIGRRKSTVMVRRPTNTTKKATTRPTEAPPGQDNGLPSSLPPSTSSVTLSKNTKDTASTKTLLDTPTASTITRRNESVPSVSSISTESATASTTAPGSSSFSTAASRLSTASTTNLTKPTTPSTSSSASTTVSTVISSTTTEPSTSSTVATFTTKPSTASTVTTFASTEPTTAPTVVTSTTTKSTTTTATAGSRSSTISSSRAPIPVVPLSTRRPRPSLSDRYDHVMRRMSTLRPVQRIYLTLGALTLFVCLLCLHLCCACRRMPRQSSAAAAAVATESPTLFGRRHFSSTDLIFLSALLLLFAIYCGMEVTLGNYLYSWARRTPSQHSQLSALLLTAAFWAGLALGRLPSLLALAKCGIRSAAPVLLVHLGAAATAGVLLVLLMPSRPVFLWPGVALLGFGLGPARASLAAWLDSGFSPAERRWLAVLTLVAAGAGEAVLPVATAMAHQVGEMDRVLWWVAASGASLCFVLFAGLAAMMRTRLASRRHQETGSGHRRLLDGEEDEEDFLPVTGNSGPVNGGGGGGADSDDPEDGTFALRKLRNGTSGGIVGGVSLSGLRAAAAANEERERRLLGTDDELDLH